MSITRCEGAAPEESRPPLSGIAVSFQLEPGINSWLTPDRREPKPLLMKKSGEITWGSRGLEGSGLLPRLSPEDASQRAAQGTVGRRQAIMNFIYAGNFVAANLLERSLNRLYL